jgi:hypothetical protein
MELVVVVVVVGGGLHCVWLLTLETGERRGFGECCLDGYETGDKMVRGTE